MLAAGELFHATSQRWRPRFTKTPTERTYATQAMWRRVLAFLDQIDAWVSDFERRAPQPASPLPPG